jgi:hypothetical protein
VGWGLPAGFKFNLTGLSGSVPDALGFIRYLDQQMAGMVLAGFLNLGDTQHGSRALGEAFIDMFTLAIQAVGDEIADTATGLAVQMVDYNWGEDEPAPRVCVAGVGTKQEVTASRCSCCWTRVHCRRTRSSRRTSARSGACRSGTPRPVRTTRPGVTSTPPAAGWGAVMVARYRAPDGREVDYS